VSLAQVLLDGAQSGNSILARAFHRLQLAAARRRDTLVRYRLNGRELWLPLSHDLPWNRRLFPAYSDNLRRLAAFVRERAGVLRMVDVGANVGDSWALAGPVPGDALLLIEGSPGWFALLERNTANDPTVTVVQALLSDRDGDAAGTIVTEGGNATVMGGGAAGQALRTETLDHVIARTPAFRETNLLKVDVEGWDPRVLRGARALLSASRPAILFEHHPRLLAAAGEGDQTVFAELAELGYGEMLLYDNIGHLIESVPARDSARLATRMDEARGRDGYYYDVIAIHDREAAARAAFLDAERAWNAARPH
jgi:FkbM family methyltransferase